MRVAVAGATGLVGRKMASVLEERNFPVTEFIPVASERSAGSYVQFKGKNWKVLTPSQALELKPQIALFSAGATVSGDWAPIFANHGCHVIDNSSRWRMDKDVKLVVPEVNGTIVCKTDMLIANPNCSTIQMVAALNLLHKQFRLKRIVVSTYQSVTGSGTKGINQLQKERDQSYGINTSESAGEEAYKSPIDLNVIPQIDIFTENGYTKEEMKMINETRKIFQDDTISISATTVRVPVKGGHSESINAEFYKSFTMDHVLSLLKETPGTILTDNSEIPPYPMPLFAFDKDEVFVGRVRPDLDNPKAINMWVVADNLRKGAATNAVQIAELLL